MENEPSEESPNDWNLADCGLTVRLESILAVVWCRLALYRENENDSRRRVFVRGLRRLVTTLNDRPGGGSQFSLFGRKRIVGNGGCRSNP